MITELTIEDFKGGDAIVLHLKIPRADIQCEMPLAMREVSAAMQEQKLEVLGPMFAYHPTTSSAMFDMEIGYPVKGAVQAQGRVKPGKLPNTKVAHTTYTGGYEGLHSAWMEFTGALHKAGHAGSGAIIEVYTSGPEADPDPKTWRTDLYVLLKN